MKEAIKMIQRELNLEDKRLEEVEGRIEGYMKEINYANERIRTIMSRKKGLEEAIKVLEKVKQ